MLHMLASANALRDLLILFECLLNTAEGPPKAARKGCVLNDMNDT